MLMLRNIDLYVQIPGLSRTSTEIPDLESKFSNSRTFQVFKDLCEPCYANVHDLTLLNIFGLH